MHFYHQDDALCTNAPEQFCTNVEVEFLSVLPRQMSLLPPKPVHSSDKDNYFSAPCWLVDDEELDAQDIGISVVHVGNINEPNS
jgi:hypothetical protein